MSTAELQVIVDQARTKVTGRKLHAIYREGLGLSGVRSDSWRRLEPTDRAAWECLAADVQRIVERARTAERALK